MFELIKEYLKENSINDFSLFSLADDGNGVYIKNWDYDIQEPSFTQEEGLLKEAKTSKINQLAKNRELKAEKSFVEYNGKPYANSQNARIAINDARQSMTASSPAVSYPTYPLNENGELITEQRETVYLNKADFTALADLIRTNERNLREQEISLIKAINSITLYNEYFNQDGEPITALEFLNAININL